MPNRRPLVAVPDNGRATLRDVYTAVEAVRTEFGERFNRLEDNLERRDARHEEQHEELAGVVQHAVAVTEAMATEKTVATAAVTSRRERFRTVLQIVVPVLCIGLTWLLSR